MTDTTETYLLLFTDTLVSNLAINASSELAINSMKVFALHNSYIIIAIASFAFALAMCFNYGFGILCFKILAPASKEEGRGQHTKIEKLKKSKYLPIILIFSAVPFFGKFVFLFAGFCRTNFISSLLIASSAKLVYYTIFIFLL